MNMRRTKPVDVTKLKDTLAQMDNALLHEIIVMAHQALFNLRPEKRTAEILCMPVERFRALANTVFQLRMEPDELPDMTSLAQLDAALAAPAVKPQIGGS
ncbi:hypothetical protein [Pseudomonas syringae pv. coryli]|uniref:hypothetical protein n=1 Tax=Pseudomonas syringae pv. coryli TaxID=317659 RepID=UPI003D265723